MTFSVVARDPDTGDLGCAAQSKFLAVGTIVLFARADAGAIATQALANVSYGPRGLALLEAGATADQALGVLVGTDELAQRRQVGLIDAAGRAAAHTGSGCTAWAGHVVAEGFACQGNMLVSAATVEAMAEMMREHQLLPLPERLIRALAAGQTAGGDARGQQSAALLVVRAEGGYGGQSDRLVDLRVDDHPQPIEELRRLLGLHRLYFEKPTEEELIQIDGSLADELALHLERLLKTPVDAADPEGLWVVLERWAGRENLEERMARPGFIDQTVLRILREKSDP